MSIINVDKIGPVGGGNTITVAAGIISCTGALKTSSLTLTSGSFSGDVTGDVTGNLTGNVTGNLTGTVTGSGANLTSIPGANITGTIPADALSNVNLDTLNSNIAILGFKVAVNGSLAKYNLVDQVIDEFSNATGIDTSASTNESLESGAWVGRGTGTITASGGTVTTDGSYKVHKFTSGTVNFVTDGTHTIDYLIVGGGGAGGRSDGGGGGGGAGGYVYKTSQSITPGTYPVVVGAGGVGTAAQSGDQYGDAPDAPPGATSSFKGDEGGGGAGGPGGSSSDSPGAGQRDGWGGDVSGKGNGGSGSGQSGKANGTGGAAGSKGTTNAGGGGSGNSGNDGGGGGGAGGAGGQSSSGTGGAGGVGLQNSITGSAVWYAAGGGGNSESGTGGTGGSSIGGNGQSQSTAGTDGAVNTGSGGGGSDSHMAGERDGRSGGSGVVIIRRPITGTVPGADLTIQSVANTASSAPSTADIVMLVEDTAGTSTINTDVKAYLSQDGSTFTQATLVDEGTWGTNKRIFAAHGVNPGGSGTAMKYKISTHNQSSGSKVVKIHAASLGWK